MPYIVKVIMISMSVGIEKLRFFRIRTCTIGSGVRHSCQTSRMNALPAMIEKYQTQGVANQSARSPRSITISPSPSDSTRQTIPIQSALP